MAKRAGSFVLLELEPESDLVVSDWNILHESTDYHKPEAFFIFSNIR